MLKYNTLDFPKLMHNIRSILKRAIQTICESATTYRLSNDDIDKILEYDQPLRIGYNYTKANTYSFRCRGISGRQEKNAPNSSSVGEFYKNSILGMVKNMPVYDGSGKFIDVESFKGALDYGYYPASLLDRCPSDPHSIVFGSDHINSSELRFVEINEFKRFSNQIKCEAFGDDSYCRIHSLIDMVRECYEVTGKKVVIVELGPGIGYWINRVGSILNDQNIPFIVLSVEYYFFNAVNTLRMAEYFGNKGKLISVMSDIHDFDWHRFFKDFASLTQCPIVVHSSECLSYVNSQAIDEMLLELSKYNLYGGCHFEGDAFTLYNLKNKRLFLDAALRQSSSFFPAPYMGMNSKLREKAGFHQFSYLDPSFRSSVINSIHNLNRFCNVEVETVFPWAPFTISPAHYTEWRIRC